VVPPSALDEPPIAKDVPPLVLVVNALETFAVLEDLL